MPEEISVYMFLGFLESGKTKFIQETFEDPRMENGENTLLLVCEEGEEEYDPHLFKVKNVFIEYIEKADLNAAHLTELVQKYKCGRVVVEYNGTWLLQDFFDAMPEDWVINQMMTFFDSATFLNYNRNMRQLVYDKIQLTQMVVFNRFKGEYEKMAFHKVVRAISRRPDIVYEYIGGKAEFDDIEDPMPFDVNAPVIEIEDKDYALFYRDVSEKLKEYIGKTVRFKGMAAVNKKVPAGYIVLGRYIMTCCEADIAYDGFAVRCGKLAEGVKTRDWLTVTGKIMYEYNSVYRSKGPVILAEKIEPAQKPEQEVATFY
ncbi:MAG TPA: GTPase [Candidatus Coproplasma excrementigallinarum]|uniref:GTPase n=1 Tax=Candidatus Coproplasma excrementigallinarum TaxID=2840747 RepID=A0A9D1MK94_9FIRM|nr:GTPase [Candidatus Coproplasma excrementigallinarum]